MSHEKVSIIVPTFREAANIPALTRRVFDALAAADLSGELILVDDDSQDGADAAVAELAKNYDVRLITRVGERGLSSAVLRGFAEARHNVFVCMDADLSHPPESLPELIAPIVANTADFTIGSRYVAGGSTREDWGLFRRLNSRVATLLARPLTAVRDPMAGFFCLRRETLQQAAAAGLNPIGYKIALEIMIKAGCHRVVEVPIEFSDRMHGKSKLTFRQQLLYLQHLGRLYRFRRPVASGLAALVLVGLFAATIIRLTR